MLHSQWQPAEAFPWRLIASSLPCIRPSWAEPGIQRLIFESGSSRWQFKHYCNSSRLTKYFLVKWHWNVFKYFITTDSFITEISRGSVQNIRLLPGNYARWNGLKKQASTSASSTAKHSCKIWVRIAQYLHERYECEIVSKDLNMHKKESFRSSVRSEYTYRTGRESRMAALNFRDRKPEWWELAPFRISPSERIYLSVFLKQSSAP